MRRSRSLIALILGLVVALGTPLAWWVTHRPGGSSGYDPGTAVALAAAAPGSRSPLVVPPTVTRGGAIPPSRSPVSPRPSPPTAARATGPASPPVRVRIDSIGVTAPVSSVGVDQQGDMSIPEDVDRVGWYRWSALPGSSQGSVVVAGHVDSAVQGLGALFRLRNVVRGSQITIVTGNGRTWHYRVVALEEFPKTTVPLDKIFARTGAPRLTLITCGGRFDASKRSYDDNIVVTAVPR